MANRRGGNSEGISSGYAARLLAIAALVSAAVVIAIVVAGSLDVRSESGGNRGGQGQRNREERQPAKDYYVIQSGDTLGGIAVKFGMSVVKLERLNPNLDTQQLPVQGCINLVADGCKALNP